MVGIAVSLFDIMSTKSGQEVMKSGDKSKLERMLHFIGFDVEYGYEITEAVTHRPIAFHGKLWKGPRIEGVERSDDQWLKSGNASNEAFIQYTKDHSLRADLIVMSRRSTNTLDAMEHLKESEKNEKKNG